MRKEQLIQQIRAHALAMDEELKPSEIDAVLRALGATVVDNLKAGKEVSIPGVGTLAVKTRAARKGRNPATGEAIDIPAKNHVDFRPTPFIRDAINP